MTQQEIIELARRAGMMSEVLQLGRNLQLLTDFAKLVAEKERDACAKLCAEDNVQAMDFTGFTFVGGYFAKRIIERGEA